MTSFALIPLVLLAVGAALVVSGIRVWRKAEKPPKHWKKVTGRVIDTTAVQRVEYRTPDGRRIELRFLLDETYVLGQEVEILVDPVDPSRAQLPDAYRVAGPVVRTLLALGIVFLVVGALAVVAFG